MFNPLICSALAGKGDRNAVEGNGEARQPIRSAPPRAAEGISSVSSSFLPTFPDLSTPRLFERLDTD
jgi:hypothetical protein